LYISANSGAMSDLTAFPCVQGDSQSRPVGQWYSTSFFTTYLEPERRSIRVPQTAVLLAYASLLWAYTGEKDVRFQVRSSEEAGVCLIHSLSFSDDLTIGEAAKNVSGPETSASPGSRHPSNVLVQIPQGMNLGSCRPYDDAPFQIYSQLHEPDRQVGFILWFDRTAITKYHAGGIVRYFGEILDAIINSKSGDLLGQTVAILECDKARIRALNATPQALYSRTIHDSFTEVFHRGPDRIAVEAWDGRLTRVQLHEMSEDLALALARAHVKRGCIVAVMMEKSMWVPVILLAILKAGGAFLLLDPALPQERLRIMANKCSLSHTVAAREFTTRACAFSPTVIVRDEHNDFQIAKYDANSPASSSPTKLPQVDPQDIAFVIFTSGSSGIPKAIRIQHFAWCSGNIPNAHTFGITKGARILQYSSYSFVISVVDTITTLLVGGTVCIPGNDERMNDLDGAIRRLQPNYACLTPSLAKSLDPSKVPSIKTLVLVGEAIPRSLAESWLASGKVVVRNGYGQSEACSMNSTVALASNDSAAYRSIGNSTWLRYWVVDPQDHDRLMPVGALGELIVEGYSIALDYYDDEEKTSAAFIRSPRWAAEFEAGTEGRKWYKTGDLVQYQENGELHLFGRKDTQTKINGQRLETSEVEHNILKVFAQEISQVVVDKTIQGGAEKLIAFVSLQAGQSTPTESDLRKDMMSRLKDTLPMWMIPSVIKIVEAFPRTATGKLDRRTLKASHAAESSSKTEVTTTPQDGSTEVADATAEAQQTGEDNDVLAKFKAIASTIVKTPPESISSSSSWVDIGGDSLTAMMFVRDARKAGLVTSTGDLISGTSLGELSDQVKAANADLNIDHLQASGVVEKDLSLSSQEGSDAAFPLINFQSHYLRGVHGVSGGLVYEYQINFRGDFELQRVEKAVRILFEHTDALRLTFMSDDATDGEMLKQKVLSPDDEDVLLRCQVHHDDGSSPPSMLSWDEHDKLQYPVLFVLRHGYNENKHNPTNGSVIGKDISLFVRIHHAVYDGISWAHMLKDLIFAYEHGRLQKQRPSYIQYLQTRMLRRDNESFEYWKKLLDGSRQLTLRREPELTNSITTDRIVEEHNVTSIITIDREKGNSTRSSDKANPNKAVSPAVISMSAWVLTLSCMVEVMHPSEDHNDILFLTLMHGRDEDSQYQADEIIGCCVTEIPIRVQLSEMLTPAEIFAAIQRQLLESAKHAHLGASTIAQHCTTWGYKRPQWYRQSTFFMFQNVKALQHLVVDADQSTESPSESGARDHVGTGGYLDVFSTRIKQDVRSDFESFVALADNGALELRLASRAEEYSRGETNAVADAYGRAVRMLTEGHDMHIGEMRRRILAEVPGLPTGSVIESHDGGLRTGGRA
jgi:amino acid adenylation domain-containing protein